MILLKQTLESAAEGPATRDLDLPSELSCWVGDIKTVEAEIVLGMVQQEATRSNGIKLQKGKLA